MSDITVFFLQASRCIRIVWLLEELKVPYNVEFADRVNQKAPQAFKDASGNPLGKFPSIKDGDVVVYESGAIIDYLCEKYDTQNKIMPKDPLLRMRTQTFIHASEATLNIHAMAILYARWAFQATAKGSHSELLEQTEKAMSPNVINDLKWLESELEASKGEFLVRDQVTAADIMMHFSVDFTFARELGTKGRPETDWPKIRQWMKRCEETESYRRAVEKSGHTLFPKTT